MTDPPTAFTQLCEIMARLRAPDGCPWDREQNHQSLTRYLIEEAYEVAEAIEEGDDAELLAELGDLLLQVVFHSQIASEDGRFSITDVIESINAKMIRRHPHVFAEAQAADSDEVLDQWSRIKKAERGDETGLLDGIPRSLPALQRAHELQSRAARVGFDWDESPQILEKVHEELCEIESARQADRKEQVVEELGDLLFAVVNWARFNRIGAEEALQQANRKFQTRFRHIEKTLEDRGQTLEEASLAEMDALWEEAKSSQGGNG